MEPYSRQGHFAVKLTFPLTLTWRDHIACRGTSPLKLTLTLILALTLTLTLWDHIAAGTLCCQTYAYTYPYTYTYTYTLTY